MRPAIFEAVLLLVAVCILWTAPDAARADGTQTGVLAGTVSDIDGVLLQGVEVQLTGLQGSRRGITDAQGRYRFPALTVGSYDLRATLLELRAQQEAVVFVGRTSEVHLTLRAPDDDPSEAAERRLEDWIQVVGEAPLVDRFETRLGADLSFEFLDDLPVERFYQSFALLLPGVAGGEDGNPNTSGALRSANLFLVDGVDTTDPTTGLFGLNLSYDAVQEVQVTTAASGVEFGRASGAVINVVTRSGGRHWSASARWTGGGDDFAGAYREGDDRANLRREIRGANSGRADLDSTLSLALGGPLWRDRLWAFASFQDSDIGFLRPTLLGDPWNSDSAIETTALKLTWQPKTHHTVIFQHSADDSRFTTFQPFSSGPAELQLPDVPDAGMLSNSFFQSTPGERFALEDRRQDGSFSKVQWNAVRGQNVAWSVTLADQQRSLRRGPLERRGLTSDAPHVGAVIDSLDSAGTLDDDLRLFLFNGVTEEGTEERPREQANGSLEVVQRWGRVDHEWRLGVDFQETESQVAIQVPGADGIDPFTGLPSSGQLYIDFDLGPACFVLGICRPFDPVSGTFQAVGVFNFFSRPARRSRERITAAYLSDTLVLDRWVIYLGARWEDIEGENGDGQDLVDDGDLAPRVAVTYSLGSERRGVLSASWGRYHEGFLHQYLDAFQRLEPLSGFTEYERRERVGAVDCVTVDVTDLRHPCWQATGSAPPVSLQPADPNTSLQRSSVDEWTLGFEYQIHSGSGFEVHWVDRSWDDLWSGVARLLADEEFVVEMVNLPRAERSYEALQVLYRQRLADRWQLLASYTWSDARGNLFRDDGLGTLGDFGAVIDTNVVNRRGPAPYDRPHQGGVFTTYELPLGQARLTLGSSLQYRDGVPFHLAQLEDAGVRFLVPRGSRRLPGVWQWDVATRLDFDLTAGVELELRAEVSNLTDEQEQLGAETLIDSGLATRPASLDDLQTPRTYRFTLGLKF